MRWMIMPLRRYAEFEGRSRRLEFWMFLLGTLIFTVALIAGIVALAAMSDARSNPGPLAAVIVLFIGLGSIGYLALIVPMFAVQVRRFHDQNRSGWLVLLGFVPYVGWLIILVFMCLPGTKGDNRHGPDPLDPEGVERLSKVFG